MERERTGNVEQIDDDVEAKNLSEGTVGNDNFED